MTKRKYSLPIIAAATLLAWIGAVHHDVWLELADIAHEHSHSHSHSHNHPHDEGDDDGDEERGAPLVLPNIHSTPFVVSGVSLIGNAVSPIPYHPVSAGQWVGDLDLRGVDCANAPPPPDWWLFTGKDAATLLLIAHCVQSNAPPSQV